VVNLESREAIVNVGRARRAHHSRQVPLMTPRSDALVVFGINGDLAFKKIFPALQNLVRSGRLDVPVVGIVREGGIDRLKSRLGDSLTRYGGGIDPAAHARLLELLRFVEGNYQDPETFRRLRQALGSAQNPLHYLAIPPSLFGPVVDAIGRSGCADGARVVVEKPLGRDLQSAVSLNAALRRVFPEQSIFRIDHFLGKEAVQNLLYFRFANSFLEPVWNRTHIDHLQITMAERFGVEGRGALYEELGAVRDVVQNHLLQVVAMLLMEPPNSLTSEDLRDENAKVLRAIRPASLSSTVRGQYIGYRDEGGVNPRSDVETFAALSLYLDSWRWSNVPILIRTGKCLAVTATEVFASFRRPPQRLFDEELPPQVNYLRFRLGPDRVSIAFGARVKSPGEQMAGRATEMLMSNAHAEEMTAYERLIGDALRGDTSLFARQDSVEASWQIVDRLLGNSAPPIDYAPGGWGPEQADRIAAGVGGWYQPLAP
jgi:glucose-6-phosphate 1-dehydrogenase